MTSKKSYTTPELNSFGEFAQLTQQSGTGLFDFIGSVSNTSISGTTTPGADPRTSEIDLAGDKFTLISL